MWADITTSTPAAMAARNGTSSTESSRAQSDVMTGSARCESVPVSPWPGKCFAVASMPWSCRPRTSAATSRPTCDGVLAERARVDDRVGGVVVDVRHRREGEVHADRAPFERGDPPDVIRRAVAPGGAHAHIGWEQRPAVEPETGAALEVGGRRAAAARSAAAAG